jgi:DNA-binding MarR family transcriptional regulator
MRFLKKFEAYEYENFTLSEMEYVMELYEDGLTDIKQLAIESNLSIETVKQIIHTLKKRGDIE